MNNKQTTNSPDMRRNETSHNRNRKYLRWCVFAAVFAALSTWALYAGLTIKAYEVVNDHSRAGSVRIVCIADLHSHIYGKNQQPLIDLIKAQQPDIIALVGDIADDEVPDDGTRMLLEGIADTAPVYYVSGNHEYWSGRYADIKAMIESYGVTVLDNESDNITVNGVRLSVSGVDDPLFLEYTKDSEWLSVSSQEEVFSRQFSDLDNSVFNVLLAHRPESIHTYLDYDFDLILSGHTHGGQVRIPPLINGLLAPDQGWLPRFGGGRYDFDGRKMIVRRGLSFNQFITRIFNPPVVMVVDVFSGG